MLLCFSADKGKGHYGDLRVSVGEMKPKVCTYHALEAGHAE